MIARYSGAGLGLLAFSVTIGAGLFVGNPIMTTLSRGILALFLFCAIGYVLGAAAQIVVKEHARTRRLQVLQEDSEA